MISNWRKSLILPQSPGIGAFSDASSKHHFSHSSLFFSMSFARVVYDCNTKSRLRGNAAKGMGLGMQQTYELSIPELVTVQLAGKAMTERMAQ